ncbi:MAG: RRXRR domain-containing protein [Alphaproteobacteria bacterium]|nr:RRXRR domain-containing protein [Alphaproteobacteria bacterium]
MRYRPSRSDHRRRPEGWLPPSLQHRLEIGISWVARLRRLTPITGLTTELVRFDLQKLDNPENAGVEYQQGTFFSYEAREYLLEKWGRRRLLRGRQDAVADRTTSREGRAPAAAESLISRWVASPAT